MAWLLFLRRWCGWFWVCFRSVVFFFAPPRSPAFAFARRPVQPVAQPAASCCWAAASALRRSSIAAARHQHQPPATSSTLPRASPSTSTSTAASRQCTTTTYHYHLVRGPGRGHGSWFSAVISRKPQLELVDRLRLRALRIVFALPSRLAPSGRLELIRVSCWWGCPCVTTEGRLTEVL